MAETHPDVEDLHREHRQPPERAGLHHPGLGDAGDKIFVPSTTSDVRGRRDWRTRGDGTAGSTFTLAIPRDPATVVRAYEAAALGSCSRGGRAQAVDQLHERRESRTELAIDRPAQPRAARVAECKARFGEREDQRCAGEDRNLSRTQPAPSPRPIDGIEHRVDPTQPGNELVALLRGANLQTLLAQRESGGAPGSFFRPHASRSRASSARLAANSWLPLRSSAAAVDAVKRPAPNSANGCEPEREQTGARHPETAR